MELKPFLPEQGDIFLEYQSRQSTPPALAHSGFVPHIIWSDLLEYRWTICSDMFFLFATAHGATHLALAPFGPSPIAPATALAFEQMAHMNPPHIPSRIDNVNEASALLLGKAGYKVTPALSDYLYCREEIVNLTGTRFHAQRAAANQSGRSHPTLRPFLQSDTVDCLSVFDQWAAAPVSDSFNRMMREDARFAHHAAMRGYRELGLTGRVVEVNKTVAGYTFGFPISQEIFCVLMEITDRSIRGLSAWLFREFCRELSSYTFINAMDDSGFASLSRAKALWHPVRMIPAYTITQEQRLKMTNFIFSPPLAGGDEGEGSPCRFCAPSP